MVLKVANTKIYMEAVLVKHKKKDEGRQGKFKFLSIPKTSTVQHLKFENGSTISSHALPGMWIHIRVGIKVNLCW